MFNRYIEGEISATDLKKMQEEKLRKQVKYVYENSEFYRRKFQEANITPDDFKGLEDLCQIPFTTKDEIRESQKAVPPLGSHIAVTMTDVIRIHASSGTTGRPTYVGITSHDNEVWKEILARALYTNGIRPESKVVFAMGLSFFVGSSLKDGIEKIGATFIPVGTGASDRVISSIQDLNADVMICTPSYAVYLAEYVREKIGIEPKDLGLKLISAGAEPGAGMPEIRKRIEEEWGCKVVECMGNADMAPIIFAECSQQSGMHFVAPDFVICEIINPETGETLPLTKDCVGELIYSAIDRECVPLLRFRTRDLVQLEASTCECGHRGFRIRCIGRTDDMLIVRGVNVFPSAIRDVVNGFRPRTTGEIQIMLEQAPPLVNPPLEIQVEYGDSVTEQDHFQLKKDLEESLRSNLIFTSSVHLVPPGTLPRFEMKAKLVKMK